MKRLAFAALLLAAPAQAAQVPTPGTLDPRIRLVDYSADQVVRVTGFPGYQITIQFAPEERIENVALGDSVTWQVTPNKKANLLFVKPTAPNGRSNMSVVTDRRTYNFDLVAKPSARANAKELIYALRFKYAEPPKAVAAAPAPAPGPINFAYKFKGSKANLPVRVYDDGRSTYFQWAEGVSTPAIFAVGTDKRESIVNYTVRNGTVVVDRISPTFTLRHGKQVTQIVNAGFAEPKPAAPQPQQQLASQR